MPVNYLQGDNEGRGLPDVIKNKHPVVIGNVVHRREVASIERELHPHTIVGYAGGSPVPDM